MVRSHECATRCGDFSSFLKSALTTEGDCRFDTAEDLQCRKEAMRAAICTFVAASNQSSRCKPRAHPSDMQTAAKTLPLVVNTSAGI